MVIAVDFDGTIVEHCYPEIGKERMFAFQTLRMIQAEGHILILWTIRHGKELDDALAFCKKNGIEFYAANQNYPEEDFDNTSSRKINADIFIDDRNIGGFIGWGEIWQEIIKIAPTSKEYNNFGRKNIITKPTLWQRLFGTKQ